MGQPTETSMEKKGTSSLCAALIIHPSEVHLTSQALYFNVTNTDSQAFTIRKVERILVRQKGIAHAGDSFGNRWNRFCRCSLYFAAFGKGPSGEDDHAQSGPKKRSPGNAQSRRHHFL